MNLLQKSEIASLSEWVKFKKESEKQLHRVKIQVARIVVAVSITDLTANNYLKIQRQNPQSRTGQSSWSSFEDREEGAFEQWGSRS